MAHFAKIENGIVTQVIVAEQDVIDSGLFGYGWVQTSYRTTGNAHPEAKPLRKNYAGVGFIYDKDLDAFIPPKPFPSWVLDKNSCLWVAPIKKPSDENLYNWDEKSQSWIKFKE